ncbi:MAG TPA: hypothetical protein PKV13_05550 [Propionicimonas sp.]|nr:hypothetical protein [Propionicimonas sp.]HRA06068.1 hypothetical protein [Propionicimonas sp.]
MNLRTLGIAIAASAVIFAFPAAAYAENDVTEPPVDYTPRELCAISANPSSLQAGGTTQISLIDAPNEDSDLSVTSADATIPNSAIQIAGKQTAVKKADADGKVSFTVTLTEPGDYILDASMVTGQFCGLTVKVSPKDKETVVDDAEDEDTAPAKANAAAAVLANTGATTLPYVAAAAALVGAGAVAVAASRRRRNNS